MVGARNASSMCDCERVNCSGCAIKRTFDSQCDRAQFARCGAPASFAGTIAASDPVIVVTVRCTARRNRTDRRRDRSQDDSAVPVTVPPFDCDAGTLFCYFVIFGLIFFPADLKRVPPCTGRELSIPFKDENCSPGEQKARRYSPAEDQQMQREEVEELCARNVIRPSTSQFARRSTGGRRKDGSLRMAHDYRDLIALIKEDSGG